MTSRVQTLDVGINKPFKDRIKSYYTQYMSNCSAGRAKVTRELKEDETRTFCSTWNMNGLRWTPSVNADP